MKIHQILLHGNVRYRLVAYWQRKLYRKVFTSREDAQAHWDKMLKDASRGKVAFGRLTEQEQALGVLAIEQAREGGYDLLTALRFYEANQSERLKPSPVLRDLVKQFLELREKRGLANRSLKTLRVTLTRFALLNEGAKVRELGPEHIERALSADWSPATCNSFLVRLGTFFEWCVRTKYLAANPCDRVDRFKVPPSEIQVFTVDEAKALLKAAKDHYPKAMPFLAIGLFAGLRSAELNALTWKDVDLDEKLITVGAKSAKMRKRRVVAISDNLAAWLKLGGSLPLRDHRRVREWVTAKAGVTWKQNAMRHSFASYHLAKHRNAAATALELGHTGNAQVLFNHYRNVVKPAQAVEYWGLFP